ncbi:hypothetical protein MTP04_16250 [Lysinibacillus sp. PLM2]|nr:hypothetical protein MTP04_16250 [Lysinibacillus sp. PLM2]
MEWNWIPLLIFLICPLMMVFMMFGGHGHGHGHSHRHGEGQQKAHASLN